MYALTLASLRYRGDANYKGCGVGWISLTALETLKKKKDRLWSICYQYRVKIGRLPGSF